MRATLIVNPAARRGRRARRLERIARILGEGGYELRIETTSAPGHATQLARRAADADADAVFALGGDGTLREVASGLLGARTALGFLPAGTANVMTYVLGLPRNPLAAATALCRAEPRPMDVGLCGREPFLMQASSGLDAFVLARIRQGLKRRFGRPAVAAAAMTAALGYRFPQIRLAVDGREVRATFAAVCNIPFYGGAWRLIPDARPDDRQLELLVFRGPGAWATVGLARDLFLRGRHLRRPDVEVIPVRESVELLDGSGAPLQIDGDPRPERPPITIALAPDRLRVLAVSQAAG